MKLNSKIRKNKVKTNIVLFSVGEGIPKFRWHGANRKKSRVIKKKKNGNFNATSSKSVAFQLRKNTNCGMGVLDSSQEELFSNQRLKFRESCDGLCVA